MKKPTAATKAWASAVPSRPYITPRTVWLTVCCTDSAPSPITFFMVTAITSSSALPSR